MDEQGRRQGDNWPNLSEQPTAGDAPKGGKVDIAGELQELGQRLATTARVLWQSEQRQELQQEVSDGLQRLRDQLSGAVDTVRTNPKVQSLKGQVEEKVEAGRTSEVLDDMRAGLAGGLQLLNEQLRRLAERLEERVTPADGADTGTPAATATAQRADTVDGEPIAASDSAAPKADLPTTPEGPAAEQR